MPLRKREGWPERRPPSRKTCPAVDTARRLAACRGGGRADPAPRTDQTPVRKRGLQPPWPQARSSAVFEGAAVPLRGFVERLSLRWVRRAFCFFTAHRLRQAEGAYHEAQKLSCLSGGGRPGAGRVRPAGTGVQPGGFRRGLAPPVLPGQTIPTRRPSPTTTTPATKSAILTSRRPGGWWRCTRAPSRP